MLQHVPRLRLRTNALLLVFLSTVLWLSLPYNNKVVLIVRWHLNAVTGATTIDERWLFEPPLFPISTDDVAVLIKTGYSTQARLTASLEAVSDAFNPRNLIVIGDYSTSLGSHFSCNDTEVPVHNALAWLIDREHIPQQLNISRLKHYSELTAAIAAGDTELAFSVGKAFGWELDAMKASSIAA